MKNALEYVKNALEYMINALEYVKNVLEYVKNASEYNENGLKRCSKWSGAAGQPRITNPTVVQCE